jgi:lysophospholipase L1-like esterase
MTNQHRKRAAFILGISLILICAVEFSLRAVYGLGSPALILLDPASGYEFRPNQHLHRFGRRIDYNSQGLRSEPLRPLTAGSERILCLGDSVTNGGALTDQSATFPYQLEAELANSGLNVQALNASAGGWAPSHEAGFIREHGLFGSKQVVWELGTHDLFGGHDLPAPSNPNFPEHAPFSATGELLSRYVWPRLVGGLKDDSPLPTPPNDEAERLACLRLLGSTAAFIQSQGAKLVFLLMPEAREFKEPDFAAVAKHDFLEEATRLNIPVINPYPDLVSSNQRGQSPLRDAIHPNPLGNRIIAKLVAAYLQHSGLNPRLVDTTR